MTSSVAPFESLAGRQGGAKALLMTTLGEFVLPGDGAIWTSTLVEAADLLGLGEKNARQAIARVADQGLIESRRHGRRVRWQLTADGRALLEAGAERIYGFGAEAVGWGGEWLIAHCPVPESQRSLRHQLRTELSFEGFGELAASLAVSPHPDREAGLRRILDKLGLIGDSVILRSRTASPDEDAALVARAWDLDSLTASYQAFTDRYTDARPPDDAGRARLTIEIVHDWRRFPFTDPELPTALLSDGWAGAIARDVFTACRSEWSEGAQRWFAERESEHDQA